MLKTPKILIVDDEPRMCGSLKELLSSQNYELETSNSAKEALEYLKKNTFDLILLDMVLPDMSGHQLMDFITIQNPDTLIIVITGQASMESAIGTLRKGAYDYIRKPFEPDALITTVKNALNQKRLIAEHKRTEEMLRESEKRFRTVFELAPLGIAIADPDGRFIDVNKTFCQMLGYNKDDAMGMTFFDITYPDDCDKTLQLAGEVYRGKQNSYQTAKRYLKKNGQPLWAVVRATAIRDSNSEIQYWLGIMEDLTERKLAEERKEKLEAQLHQAKKMEAIGTLAGGIAHDFNNLLMGILGRTSLMLMETDSTSPNFGHLKGIEDYVKSATDLTKQLLAFARGGKYEVKPVDLNELINKSSEMFGRTKKEITIHKKIQKKIWTVEVDQSQIEQVMLNLYVNAWQSMPGGGELYLETENVVLDEHFVKPFDIKPGKYVKFSVTDTGIGMDKATQERIFDPFFTTKELGRGTGLGLASAYGIIKNHGGIIDVYSEKGKGSTFIICLPASEKEIVKEKEPDKEVIKGDETILLVDDEDIIIDVGKEMLKKTGYKVLIAKSGKAAVELYEANQSEIDMVILDMIMPEMGGGETYDRLKVINPCVKVLLASGYSVDGQATEIMERGCDSFIQKPFNIKDLSNKIRGILYKD